jgi:hypothetical protein
MLAEIQKKRQAINELEKALLSFPQMEIPLTHFFAPDIYLRQVVMPAGALVIGHEHLTEHFNIVLTGRATVSIDGYPDEEIKAPCVFKSGAGVRKALIIHEEMTWLTVHHTNEKDEEKRDAALIKKSASFLEYNEQKTLKDKESYGMGCSRNGGGWRSWFANRKEKFKRWGWRINRKFSTGADSAPRP